MTDHSDVCKYVICRIIGNELPPRDLPGSRLATFQHIIENEFVDRDVKRLWVLNRLLDQKSLEFVKDRLVRADESYIELEVDWPSYSSTFDVGKKLNVIIGINQARNEGFRRSSEMGSLALILDGDCFFNRETWTQTRSQIEVDQESYPRRKYYAVPMVRVQLDSLQDVDVMTLPSTESMLAIRHDAVELFDESLPFGKGEKVALLYKLGLRKWDNRWYELNSAGPCRIVGRVIHLSVGSSELDHCDYKLWLKRNTSLQVLLLKTDAMASAMILRNEGIRKYLKFQFGSLFGRIRHRCQQFTFRLPKMLRSLLFGLLKR